MGVYGYLRQYRPDKERYHIGNKDTVEKRRARQDMVAWASSTRQSKVGGVHGTARPTVLQGE